MIRRCPVCLRATPYAPGDEFGCSPECRFDWIANHAATPAPALRIGDRVRIHEPWSPFHGLLATVDEERDAAFGCVRVVVDGDPRPMRVPATACEVLP